MSRTMTSVERVSAVIELRAPDRVPVDLHNFQPAALATGLPLREVFQDGELLAQAMLDAWREFRHDMILLENGTAGSAQACGGWSPAAVHAAGRRRRAERAMFRDLLARGPLRQRPDPARP